jgi:hypothetical protein
MKEVVQDFPSKSYDTVMQVIESIQKECFYSKNAEAWIVHTFLDQKAMQRVDELAEAEMLSYWDETDRLNLPKLFAELKKRSDIPPSKGLVLVLHEE